MRTGLIALALSASACAGDLEDRTRFEDPAVCDLDVQQDILIPRCAVDGCHMPQDPPAGLEYLSPGLEQRMVGVPATTCLEQMRIDPANPEASHILVRISDAPTCGDEPKERMPLIGPELTDVEAACIRSWVIELAGGAP